MSNENQNPENEVEEITMSDSGKSSISLKVLIIGVPVFIIQLIAVYFITANILLDKIEGSSVSTSAPAQEVHENEEGSDTTQQASETFGQFIYSVDDIIVNPAGTNGQQLLLTSIAFDLGKEEDQKNLEGKEVVIKDMIISILSSKNISHLSNTAYKDSLRFEISRKLKEFIPDVSVNKVYFSKYIIN